MLSKEETGQYGFSICFMRWYADRIREHGKADIAVVIVCSARKDPDAGYMKTKKGRRVMFADDPELARKQTGRKRSLIVYRHPDDSAREGKSWKEILREYNEKCVSDPSANKLNLLQAWQLYSHRAYGELVRAFGLKNVFILSGGWGLISADFLTPDYNITFSSSAAKNNPWALRKNLDCDTDLMMLPENTDKPVIFLGGKEYVPFFCCLTKNIKSERIVFYNSKKAPDAPGCELSLFDTNTQTNWYYKCVRDLCEAQKELIENNP